MGIGRSIESDRQLRWTTMARLGVVAGTVAVVSGCLMTSPYWDQEFSTRASPVPIQVYATDNSKPVRFDCAPATNGNLYPTEADASWMFIADVVPQPEPSLDSYGAKVYGASLSTVLPAACWRYDPEFQYWYVGVRATQSSASSQISYKTFTRAGLECLGRENGKAASWFGWMNKGCNAIKPGSLRDWPYAIIRAKT